MSAIGILACYAPGMKLPRPLEVLWNGWKTISHAIGRVMSFIILSVLWVVAIGIYALILRLTGGARRAAPATYWIPVKPQQADDLLHQF